MFVMENFLLTLAKLIEVIIWLFKLYMFIIIVGVFLSWVNPGPYSPYSRIVYFINRMTEPVLFAVRRRLPALQLPIDISPLVVIIIITMINIVLDQFIVQSLTTWAASIGQGQPSTLLPY